MYTKYLGNLITATTLGGPLTRPRKLFGCSFLTDSKLDQFAVRHNATVFLTWYSTNSERVGSSITRNEYRAVFPAPQQPLPIRRAGKIMGSLPLPRLRPYPPRQPPTRSRPDPHSLVRTYSPFRE